MPNVSKVINYDLPDEYLSSSRTLGLVANWQYNGPQKMYVFVSNETGELEFSKGFIAYDDRNPSDQLAIVNIRAGVPSRAVLVDVDVEPIIAAIMIGPDITVHTGIKEYKLDGDDTVYYSRPDPTYPDHTYEVSQIRYDLQNNAWIKPFAWKLPHITVEQHNQARAYIIAGIDRDLADPLNGYTPEMVTALENMKEELSEIPVKFAAWADKPWMIPFPNDPRIQEEQDQPTPPVQPE